MKMHKTYRPKGLSKAEDEWLRSQERRAIIMTILTLVAGAVVIAIIFNMAGSAL